jgi:hypothetical protein
MSGADDSHLMAFLIIPNLNSSTIGLTKYHENNKIWSGMNIRSNKTISLDIQHNILDI